MLSLLDCLTHNIIAPAVKKKWFSKPFLPFRRYLGLYQQAFEMGVGIGYAHRHNFLGIVSLLSHPGREEELANSLKATVQKHLSESPNAATLFDLGMNSEQDRCEASIRKQWFIQTGSNLSHADVDKWADTFNVPLDNAHGNIGTVISLGIALGGAFPEKAKQLWVCEHERTYDEELIRLARTSGLNIPAKMPDPVSIDEFSEKMRPLVDAYVAEYRPDILLCKRKPAKPVEHAVIVPTPIEQSLLVFPYVTAGAEFTQHIVTSLGIQGWKNGCPVFTDSERKAIESGQNDFQFLANERTRLEAIFNPDTVEPIQRQLGGEALKRLADHTWKDSGELPANWMERLSTYLKAWSMTLDPNILLDVADLLALAWYQADAKRAAEIVATLFPGYAPRYFVGTDESGDTTEEIVSLARDAIQVYDLKLDPWSASSD